MYDDNADKVTEPYAEYNSTSHTVNDDEWLTALNPQNNHTAVGTDMMVFNCVDTEGNPLIIDNEHTDGRGEPANTGNWMVTYNDNITLVNSGTRARTFKVYKAGATGGCLMSCIRDKDGKVYNPMMNIHPILYTGELPRRLIPPNTFCITISIGPLSTACPSMTCWTTGAGVYRYCGAHVLRAVYGGLPDSCQLQWRNRSLDHGGLKIVGTPEAGPIGPASFLSQK